MSAPPVRMQLYHLQPPGITSFLPPPLTAVERATYDHLMGRLLREWGRLPVAVRMWVLGRGSNWATFNCLQLTDLSTTQDYPPVICYLEITDQLLQLTYDSTVMRSGKQFLGGRTLAYSLAHPDSLHQLYGAVVDCLLDYFTQQGSLHQYVA